MINKSHSVNDFKVRCFESWPDYFDFLSSPKTSKIGSTWQWPDGIAYLLSPAKNELLTESELTSFDRKNAKRFIEEFKSYDKRSNVEIRIGNSISVISSSLDLNKKSITVRGYLTPRTIAAINYDDDGSIDCIEFDNGDQFPERNELTMVDGQYVLNTIFFSSAAESEEAHSKIWMAVSRMEGSGWVYSNRLEESKIITKGINSMSNVTAKQVAAAKEKYDWVCQQAELLADAMKIVDPQERAKIHRKNKSIQWGKYQELKHEFDAAEKGNVTEAADPAKKIASLEKQYDTMRGRLGMAKDKRRMKGDRLLSPAEQKLMTKMSDLQAQINLLKQAAKKKVDESFFAALDTELDSFAANRESMKIVGSIAASTGSGTADDPYLSEGAERYTMTAKMSEIAKKLDKPVHFVYEGHAYVATVDGIMESEEFELEEAAKPRAGETKDEHYGQWRLTYEIRPKAGAKEFRGVARHLKSLKTPPVEVIGSSADDVRNKLVATIDSTKSQKMIDPSKRVMIDFNVHVTRNIIGHKDTIYGDVELIDGTPTLLISVENQPGFQKAADRTPVSQRTEGSTGQHAFSLSGKKAIAGGLTHARYVLGEPFDYMAGITAYPLKFSSEVHPDEIIYLKEPGVTVAYPRGVAEGANEEGVFEGIFDRKKKREAGEMPTGFQDLTEPQRDLIYKFFAGRDNNVKVKWGKDGAYVLPKNAYGHHNNTVFRFYNDEGKLFCSIEYYRTASEAGNIRQSPLTHITDIEVKGPWHLESLMKKYGGDFEEKFVPESAEVDEARVWSGKQQKMIHHSEFPHTHTVAKDIMSSMDDEPMLEKGARLSYLGNDNYLDLDTGIQPYKIEDGEADGYITRRIGEDNITEAINNQFVIEGTASEFFGELKEGMRDIVDNFADYQTKGYSQPAAPDTSKFIAAVGGMIEYAENVHVYGGKYGNDRTYKMFIKVGGAISPEVRDDIREEFAELVSVLSGRNWHDMLYTEDGYRFFFVETNGTNWGGFGVVIDKKDPPPLVVESDEGKARIRGYKDRNGIKKWEVLNADGVRVKGDLSHQAAKDYLTANRSEMMEGAKSSKKWCVSYELPNGDKKCLEFTTATAGEALAAAKKKVSGGVNWNVKNYDVKKVSEGSEEQLDELSPAVKMRYLSKAVYNRDAAAFDSKYEKDPVKAAMLANKVKNRDAGVKKVLSVDEGTDEKLADLTKIDTAKLQEIHALHRHYGERDDLHDPETVARLKASTNRVAAELAKRGIKVPTIDEGVVTEIKQNPGETDAAFLDRKADHFVKNGPSTPAHNLTQPGIRNLDQVRKDYSDMMTSRIDRRPVKEETGRKTNLSPKELDNTIAIYKNDLRCAYGNGESAQRIRQLKAKIAELEGYKNEPISEAKGLNKRVKIVKGPEYVIGKLGWIGEVRHGAYKGAPKTFTVDLDNGGGSIQLPASHLRLVKDEHSDGEWQGGAPAGAGTVHKPVTEGASSTVPSFEEFLSSKLPNIFPHADEVDLVYNNVSLSRLDLEQAATTMYETIEAPVAKKYLTKMMREVILVKRKQAIAVKAEVIPVAKEWIELASPVVDAKVSEMLANDKPVTEAESHQPEYPQYVIKNLRGTAYGIIGPNKDGTWWSYAIKQDWGFDDHATKEEAYEEVVDAFNELVNNGKAKPSELRPLDQAEYQGPEQPVEEGIVKDIKRAVTGKSAKSRAREEIAKSLDARLHGDDKDSAKHFRNFDRLDALTNPKEVDEGVTGKLAITPENVLSHVNGNWSDTLYNMGYSDAESSWKHPNCKKILKVLDQLVKQGKLGFSTYPAEDNVYFAKEPVKEGWKGAVAGIAAAGAIATGIGLSPKLDVDGETYDLALSSTTAPADAKVVKKNGETFKVWKQPQAVKKGPGPNTTNVYQKVEESTVTEYTDAGSVDAPYQRHPSEEKIDRRRLEGKAARLFAGDVKKQQRWVDMMIRSEKAKGSTNEDVVTEKSKSAKQARFMAAAAHDPKFAKKVGIKQSVAKEFNQADKGSKLLKKATTEGWKGTAAAVATAASLAASPAAGIVLNPARVIDARGNTVADPNKNPPKAQPKKIEVDAMTGAAPVVKPPKKVTEAGKKGTSGHAKEMAAQKKAYDLEQDRAAAKREREEGEKFQFGNAEVTKKGAK